MSGKTNVSDNNSYSYTLFDFSPEAIIVTDLDFVIVYSNPIALQIFESSFDDLSGKDFNSLLSLDGQTIFNQKIKNKLQQDPSKIISQEIEGTNGNGKTFPFEVFISRLNKDGFELNIIFLRNIDVRKKYLNELSLLRGLTTDVSNASTLYDAFEITLKNVCAHFDWDYGEVWMKSEDNQFFEYQAGWMIEESALKEFAQISCSVKLPLKEGMPHEVAKGNVLWATNISSKMGFIRFKIIKDTGLKTCVGLPIMTNKELLACMLFFSFKEKAEEENTISILSSLSNHLAVLLQKKRAEVELIEREYFIKHVVELSPSIISVHDIINNKSIYTNIELTEALGYTKEDIQNMKDNILVHMVHSEDIPKVIERNVKYQDLKDNEVVELEIRLKSKSGEIRWVNTRAKIFKRTSDGKPWITISSAIDVTNSVNDRMKLNESQKALKMLNATLEQKVEERTRELNNTALELAKREKLLSLITNNLPAYVSYIDKNYVYRFANNRYLNINFINEDITGKSITEALPEKYHKRNIPLLDMALRGEDVSFESSVTLKDGSKHHIYSTYIPDFAENGEIRGAVLLGIDMTDRIEFENRLKEQNDHLKKINHDLDNFVYIASHELKAPVTNIQGLLNVLCNILNEENKMSVDLNSICGKMNESSVKFFDTVQNLLEVNRIQRNLNEDVSEFSIAEILNDVKKDLGKMIEDTDALIKESIDSCPKIKHSKSNIKTIVYNILLNSLQFKDPNRQLFIEVSCSEPDPNHLILEFADNGTGIKKEHQNKIFQLFRRYNNSNKGSGVGLYIVRRIIEDNGGKIELESEESKGTKLKIFLKREIEV
jgi:PAS domain S-box-containing protein